MSERQHKTNPTKKGANEPATAPQLSFCHAACSCPGGVKNARSHSYVAKFIPTYGATPTAVGTIPLYNALTPPSSRYMIAIIPHMPGIFGFWAFLAMEAEAESNAAVVIVDMDMEETCGLGVVEEAAAIAGPSEVGGLGVVDDVVTDRATVERDAVGIAWTIAGEGRMEADAMDSRARHRSRGYVAAVAASLSRSGSSRLSRIKVRMGTYRLSRYRPRRLLPIA